MFPFRMKPGHARSNSWVGWCSSDCVHAARQQWRQPHGTVWQTLFAWGWMLKPPFPHGCIAYWLDVRKLRSMWCLRRREWCSATRIWDVKTFQKTLYYLQMICKWSAYYDVLVSSKSFNLLVETFKTHNKHSIICWIIPYFISLQFQEWINNTGGELNNTHQTMTNIVGGIEKTHTSNHDQPFNIIIQSLGGNDCAVNGSAAEM